MLHFLHWPTKHRISSGGHHPPFLYVSPRAAAASASRTARKPCQSISRTSTPPSSVVHGNKSGIDFAFVRRVLTTDAMSLPSLRHSANNDAAIKRTMLREPIKIHERDIWKSGEKQERKPDWNEKRRHVWREDCFSSFFHFDLFLREAKTIPRYSR